MLVLWPDAADLLRHMLRDRGLDPNRVASPAAAWPVFREFLAVDIDGLAQDGNSDSFAVYWGRHDWSDRLPTLRFVRQLRLDSPPGRTAGRDGPTQRRLSLDMVFKEQPAFADVDELNTRSSGFYTGPVTDDVAREALWEVEQYPALAGMWTCPTLWSAVSFGTEPTPGRDPATFDAQQVAAYLDYRARNG